jgi:hypothetical protein
MQCIHEVQNEAGLNEVEPEMQECNESLHVCSPAVREMQMVRGNGVADCREH